jgi:hypothetical protein
MFLASPTPTAPKVTVICESDKSASEDELDDGAIVDGYDATERVDSLVRGKRKLFCVDSNNLLIFSFAH